MEDERLNLTIENIRTAKLQSIRKLIGSRSDFQFAESLKASFDVNGTREAVEPIWMEKVRSERLEPVIISFFRELTFQDRIRPQLTLKVTAPESAASQQSDVAMEDVDDLSPLLKLLQQLGENSNSQIQSQQLSTALQELANLPQAKLEAVLPSIKFESWSEDIVSDLFSKLSEIQDTTSTSPILLVHAAVFFQITALTMSASRLLLNSLIQLAKENGRCVVFGLLLPLLFQSDLKKPQAELISKVASEALTSPYKTTLLEAILSEGETYFASYLFIFPQFERKFLKPWNSEVFQVLHSLCASQPLVTFTKPMLFDLLKPLQVIVQANPKDKPSMQLLLAITSKYPQILVELEGLTLIEAICDASTMFLKRAILAQLTSIKKSLTSTVHQ